MKAKRQLTVLYRQLKIGKPEIRLQPLKKRLLKDASASIEGVAGEPDQLRLVKLEPTRLVQLLPQLANVNEIAQPHRTGAIHQCERSLCFGEILPDKLQHQQLVEIRIQ